MIRHLTGCLPAVLSLATFCASAQVISSNGFWEPITDPDRQTNAPVVDKEAGVEALFWKVHVDDEAMGGRDFRRFLRHYVRLKVFDEKGKEAAATIDIETPDHTYISDVAARTVKPDGSIVEMKREAVHVRDLVRAGGRKIKVTSFAPPAVEPGAIVEYRYTEYHDRNDFRYQRLQFQREYPVRRVTYYMRPLSQDYVSAHMAIWPFHCQPSPLKPERDGSESVALENVPAFHEEPKMLAEANVRPWALLYYREDDKRDPDKYWNEIGRKRYGELKQALKVDNQIKQTVAEITAGKQNEAAVAALLDYLWKHTRGFDDPGVTDADRAKVKMPKDRPRTPAEILGSGLGSADELNIVFAALAANAGLEARPALMPSRQDIYFDPKMADEYFLDNVDMAVKIGNDWKIYDVSARHLPPGMLSWPEEGVKALLSDPKKPSFVQTPYSPPEANLWQRVAKFALSDDGTLEGDITETYTGHAAGARRGDFAGESEARQQEIVKEGIVAIYAHAEVTAISVSNVDDSSKALEIRYHLKLDGYATRTAKRILIQPLYFQRASSPMFTATTRNYDIAFQYPWQELDAITIKLPEGAKVEPAQIPAPIQFGTGSYSLNIKDSATELTVSRLFVFGQNGALFLGKKDYAMLKGLFDEIHGRDMQAISLAFAGGGGGQ